MRVFFLSSLFFLCLIGGIMLAIFDLEPARSLRLGVTVADHLYREATHEPADPFDLQYGLWSPASEDWNIRLLHKEGALEGYTLLSDLTTEEARLVSMDGEVLHRWALPLADIWEQSDVVPAPDEIGLLRWEKVHLFPDGSLMAVVTATEATPYGRGLIYMDKDSNLIWKFLDYAHHDFDIGPDGKIYVLTHQIFESLPEGSPWKIQAPYLGDELVVLSPDGEELQRIDLFQAMLTSPLDGIPFLLPEHRGGDNFHANSVDYVTEELAAAHPYAKEGQILLSFRESDLIALLDLTEETMPWAIVGPWRRQHDPDMLPNGNMLVYDNNGRLLKNNRTRVIEFNPVTLDIAWIYQGTDEEPFYNSARGSQQRLENGNTLITDSHYGRIFEVTPEGETVWELWNSSRRQHDGKLYVGSLRGGLRFKAEELDFPFNHGEISQHLATRH